MFHWSQGAVYLIIVWPIRIENIGSNSLQCIDIHYGISPCIPGLVPSIYKICHHSANLCRFHMGYYSFFFCASSFTPISCRLLFLFLFFSCIVDVSCSPPILIVLAVTFWLFSQPFGFSVLVLLGHSFPTVPIHLSLLLLFFCSIFFQCPFEQWISYESGFIWYTLSCPVTTALTGLHSSCDAYLAVSQWFSTVLSTHSANLPTNYKQQ